MNGRVRKKERGIRLPPLAALIAGVALGALFFAPAPREEPKAGALLPLVPDAAYSDTANTAEPTSDPSCTESVRLDSSVIEVSVGGEPRETQLEDYLVGVLAGEMPVSSEPAALEAQAVAARTFAALHMAGRAVCRSGCTVCDDPSCCQAYLTDEELREKWGGEYEANIEKLRAAVDNTRGLVAVYEGELISAFYHASSGAATESSEEVFACALPYLVSVESPEGDSEVVTRKEFSAETLTELLNEAYPEANMSLPLKEGDLDVWGRTQSGRVQLIQIGETVIPGTALRRVLGLKSTAFEIEKRSDEVVFTCYGYGHGVGMSQVGANEMARAGAGFEEILKHYYTGTQLAVLTFGQG